MENVAYIGDDINDIEAMQLVGFSCCPADAVEALHTLGARLGIACHFGTWQLANEGYEETLSDLAISLRKNGIPESRFIAPENGQTLRGSVS